MAYLSDIAIAQSKTMQPIASIAKNGDPRRRFRIVRKIQGKASSALNG